MSFYVSDPSWPHVAGSPGRQLKNKGLFSSKDGTLLSEDTAILKGNMPEARKRFRGKKRCVFLQELLILPGGGFLCV